MSTPTPSESVANNNGSNTTAETPAAGGSPKKRKRSVVWDHFHLYMEDGNQRCRCNYCPANYVYGPSSMGTTNLLSHMHKCKNNPDNRKKSHQIEDFCRAANNSEGGTEKREISGLAKFDQKLVLDALIRMIVIDELPFRFVENEGFKYFISVACPLFCLPSRSKVGRDCLALYKVEKESLKTFFRKSKQRISLTTDLWTSNQNLTYMCLTAHFIDDDWKLQKRIINFMACPSHKGEEVGLLIEELLNVWGVDNVFSVTVDNAIANDKTVAYLKKKFVNKGTSVAGGKYLHVRCVAHIINLIVKCGLKKHNESIQRIRHLVKYVRGSPARLLKFNEFAGKEGVETKKSLAGDVTTRWNSTYLMLNRANLYKNVFERYRDEDASMRGDFPLTGENAFPEESDWAVGDFMEKILEPFHDITIRVSGTSYVTSNIFMDEIGTIYNYLKDWIGSENECLVELATKMKEKFDKYWGVENERANLIFYVASILDPRYKFHLVKAGLIHMFGEELGKPLADLAFDCLKELFEDYKKTTLIPKSAARNSGGSSSSGFGGLGKKSSKLVKPNMSFYNNLQATMGNTAAQTELEKYLAADLHKQEADDFCEFQILEWWKDHKRDFPVLARMARDVYAIPVSTVASESAFSTGGRVIDDYRASMAPSTAEALICTQDWIRHGRILTDEEEFEIIQEIDNGNLLLLCVLNFLNLVVYIANVFLVYICSELSQMRLNDEESVNG